VAAGWMNLFGGLPPLCHAVAMQTSSEGPRQQVVKKILSAEETWVQRMGCWLVSPWSFLTMKSVLAMFFFGTEH